MYIGTAQACQWQSAPIMTAVAVRDDPKRSHHMKAVVAATAPHLAYGRQNRQPQQLQNQIMIEEEVRARLDEYEMTDEVRQRMARCIEALEAVANRLGRKWRVSPFGSAANGFGTKFSDLDATCYELKENEDEEEQKQPAEILSERLAPLLREHSEFAMAQEVLHARVPILKLCFEGELEVDLSCHNTLPLQNTKLLKAYSSLDERVRDLVITVKLWAKAHEVCGASQSHLSSYALTLMAIYFMQVHPKIKLVMLPVGLFKEDGNPDVEQKVKAARSSWNCSLSLGQMVLRFFQFYSQEFSWGKEVVSVRFGQRISSNETVLQKLKGRHCDRLHVEDPVDESRNLNCVLGEMQEMCLLQNIQATYARLQKHEGSWLVFPPQRAAKEEPHAGGEPAARPGRKLSVHDHLPIGQERMPAPTAAEALRHTDAEVTANTRTHSLSEASTAASCASSTDEATNEHQDHIGVRAADTGAYLEAPNGGAMRGHRHAKESRNGRESGTEACWMPGPMDKGFARGYGQHPEHAMHEHLMVDQGQEAGKSILRLVKCDVQQPADTGRAWAPASPPVPSSTLLPQPPQMAQSFTSALKTGQPVNLSPTAPPAAAPRPAEQQARPCRARKTLDIMAKVKISCEAHNQTEEKVWQ